MNKRTKDTLKNIGKALIAISIFVGIAIWLPDSSLFKKIFGYIMGVAIIGAGMVFTGVWRSIIQWFSSNKKKD